MQDPYNYAFIQKDNTMYLSTITKNDFGGRPQYNRESTFQKKDIDGTIPKTLIPQKQSENGFLSTYVEPIPNNYKHLNKTSNPLRIDDIEGARPKANEFRTKRQIDPLQPKYRLPSCNEVSVDQGRNFIRDPLNAQDINNKKKPFFKQRGLEVLREQVKGSQPMPLTKQVNQHPRLQVKDINKDGIFESKRTTNPLNPNYNWRDNEHEPQRVNQSYGQITGNQPKKLHPTNVNRQNDLFLNTRDIQGTTSNSAFNRAHMMDKRKQFRNYMQTQDIDKANSSSLKKGIQTVRQTNPLMPSYKFPGHSQISGGNNASTNNIGGGMGQSQGSTWK